MCHWHNQSWWVWTPGEGPQGSTGLVTPGHITLTASRHLVTSPPCPHTALHLSALIIAYPSQSRGSWGRPRASSWPWAGGDPRACRPASRPRPPRLSGRGWSPTRRVKWKGVLHCIAITNPKIYSIILTHDIEVGQLALHGVCVDLTHVVPGVCSPDVGNLEPPDVAVRLRDLDPVVLGDDVFAHGENSLSVHSDPGNLNTRRHILSRWSWSWLCVHLEPVAVWDVTRESRVAPHHHTRVHHRGQELRVAGILNIFRLSTFHQWPISFLL